MSLASESGYAWYEMIGVNYAGTGNVPQQQDGN